MKTFASLLLAQMTAYNVYIHPLIFGSQFSRTFYIFQFIRLDNFFIIAFIQEFLMPFSFTFIFFYWKVIVIQRHKLFFQKTFCNIQSVFHSVSFVKFRRSICTELLLTILLKKLVLSQLTYFSIAKETYRKMVRYITFETPLLIYSYYKLIHKNKLKIFQLSF